ncbi:regulator of G-protein signaling 9-binding protein isoform X2 [Sardina pilchardus]|uniref:regulator of G-protein signaling 9-binding protein isoform X2 n=1 Tax=Sardina pilchardus TaxID=27697 RepID=UPI002E11A1DD
METMERLRNMFKWNSKKLQDVVACHRHLASCVGGSTDSPHLRQELRQTRERAHELVLSCRQHLTSKLKDKTLPEAERKDAELLWVAFSSSVELLHADMCKVFKVGNNFSLANTSALVQTGLQGDTKEVAARALSLSNLQHEETGAQSDSVERQELTQLEQEIAQVDRTIEDMEQKVNVMRWTVEARGPQYGEMVSTDSASLSILGADDEASEGTAPQSQMFMIVGLCGVAAVAVAICVCVVFLA